VTNTKGCSLSQYRFNELDTFRAQPALNVFAEYQLRKQATVRVEGNNLFQQRYERAVSIFAGPRASSPLDFTDRRVLRSSASIAVSLRKVF